MMSVAAPFAALHNGAAASIFIFSSWGFCESHRYLEIRGTGFDVYFHNPAPLQDQAFCAGRVQRRARRAMTNSLSPRTAPPALVLFALAMGGFAIGTTEFGTMGLVPYFAHSFGIDGPQAGHVIRAYALGVVVGAPVIAVLAAKLPRRTVLAGLMIFFAITNGLSAFAPSYHWML